MNNEEKLVCECVQYFKNNIGFKRTMKAIRKKYESLGYLGGTVVLNNLTEEEKEALTGLFRKDYYKKSTSFKVENLVNSLSDTKFDGVDFEKVLEQYFGLKIISKKEERLIYNEERQKYFTEIANYFSGTKAEKWILYFLYTKDNAYRIISIKYDENKELLKQNLIKAGIAFNNLPFDENQLIRLALFSSNITKNPHTFDTNTDCGNLLSYAICYYLNLRYPQNAEELNEVLYKGGIIKDEVSNYTLCSGILAYSEGKEHKGWREFYENCEPLQISLWNISKVDNIVSHYGRVFVFENPTVFSEVLFRIGNKKPSLICTFGNFKLASLILMDKLTKSGAKIYYSGDFDPEGIIMADKLKQRYGEKLKLLDYSKKNYLSIKSSVNLDEYRIKKMNNIKSLELIEMVEVIKENKVAGYQELLIDKYVCEILKIINT